MTLCILGRQPHIGLAELESIFGAAAIQPVGDFGALVNTEIDLSMLGGTMKAAEVISELPASSFDKVLRGAEKPLKSLLSSFPPEGKVKLGLSLYGINETPQRINAGALNLKRVIKKTGRSVRVVPNNAPQLSSAQVIHNQLLSELGIELLIVKDGDRVIIARTTAEQDIESYAKRDREKPKRDAFVGMLPPKLAQIMINLGLPNDHAVNGPILDPFCGTGTLLMEAALRGLPIYGTDLAEKMTRYSRDNINWLYDTYQIHVSWYLETADATDHTWRQPVGAVIGETYLGTPLSGLPNPEKLESIIHTCNLLHRKFLSNIAPQLESGTKLCLAVPAWSVGKNFKRLPVLRDLDSLGFKRSTLKYADWTDLIYHRDDQIVARELVILTKK